MPFFCSLDALSFLITFPFACLMLYNPNKCHSLNFARFAASPSSPVNSLCLGAKSGNNSMPAEKHLMKEFL